MNQNTNISQASKSTSTALLAQKFIESYDREDINLIATSFSVMIKEIESLYEDGSTNLSSDARISSRLSLFNLAPLLLFKVDIFLAELNESELHNDDIESIMTVVHDLTCALNALEKTTLVDQLASSFARGLYVISQDLIQLIEGIPDLLNAIAKGDSNV